MAVLVEAISLVVRRQAVAEKYPGGWESFAAAAPAPRFCADGRIACIGFMTPASARAYSLQLARSGLTFSDGGASADFTVVDQLHGPMTPCDWLEFDRILLAGDAGRLSVCWHRGDAPPVSALAVEQVPQAVATPDGWRFDGSLSQKFTHAPSERK